MTSVEEDKGLIDNLALTDEEIQKVRGQLYMLASIALDDFYEQAKENTPFKKS
jgi:hypothetical protein